MSLDQAPEALSEGSKRNLGYQTVSKFYNLIVESSGSTRRIQRAQDRENPTSVGQDIVHRTIHDQGVQYRPSVHNYPLLPRIYNPCHSRKTINRAPFHLEKGPKAQGIKGDSRSLLHPCSSSTTAGPPLEGPSLRRTTAGPPAEGPILRRTTAGPPVEGPTLCRTTSRRPYTSPDHRRTTSRRPYTSPDHRRTTSRRPYTLPDHHPKALYFAGPPPEGPTLRSRPEVQPKALHPRSRPEVQPKALRSAQDPKFSLRPYTPLKAQHPTRLLPNFCQTPEF
ncbi:hypothetical protein M5K25_019482 [Dendrobium thyrsiflorum]|uniref:Uncharacterized protein n=1 Tax=Dendrobium thyrsiflorum TaxID=117978 RepID=A0ABD0UFA3_DENTH